MNTLKPLRKETVLSRQIGDELMLFDSSNSKVHVINEIAGVVWDMCDGTNSVDDIKLKLKEDYNIGPGHDVDNDIKNIITEFDELEVIDGK